MARAEVVEFTAEHEERLRFWRIAMAMRSDVRSLQHDIQKPMGVVLHADMEIMICAQAGGLAGSLE